MLKFIMKKRGAIKPNLNFIKYPANNIFNFLKKIKLD